MNERIDLLERGDNFAPATARVNWSGSITVSPSSTVTLPISGVSELTGNIFEHVSSSQALRIKQAGVFGYFVDVICGATGVGNIRVMMRQASPTHDWALVGQPYYLHSAFAFAVGGVRFVDVPAGGANYQIWVMNSGGSGSFTLYSVNIRIAYLGRR
jgi:hypothetical protein